MRKLTIAKDRNNNYIISDNNDERLNIIAQILLDKQLSDFFYNTLSNISDVIANNKFYIKSSDKNTEFEFNQKSFDPDDINNITDKKYSDKIIIRTRELKKPKNIDILKYDHETDILKEELVDLIIKFQELKAIGKDFMTLSYKQDNFNLD